MIAGIDTLGKVYLSLIQANSNGSIIEIFFSSLCNKLDKERPRWRRDTVIMMDNAPYHTSHATRKVLEKFQVPVLFTGPHSYDIPPCELLFAAFKDRDINPRHIPTGKR